MPNGSGSPGDIIKLNIGGNLYVSTRKTISQVPNSILHLWFADKSKPPNLPIDDGNLGYLLVADRDGPSFRWILAYLRAIGNQELERDAILPDSDAELRLLELEAEYFRLDNLREIIKDRRHTRDSQEEWKIKTCTTTELIVDRLKSLQTAISAILLPENEPEAETKS